MGTSRARKKNRATPAAGERLELSRAAHPLTEELLTYDVDASWWGTPGAYERGYCTRLYAALQHWIETAFPFAKAYYSNTEIPQLPG